MRQIHKRSAPYLMSHMAAEMQDLELSFSQVGALFHLRAFGTLTVSALAERAHLSLPAASQMVERLVQRGLLARSEDPSDRRQKLVVLTGAGEALLERIERLNAEAYGTLLAGVPPEVLDRAGSALEELLAHLPESACLPPVPPKEPV